MIEASQHQPSCEIEGAITPDAEPRSDRLSKAGRFLRKKVLPYVMTVGLTTGAVEAKHAYTDDEAIIHTYGPASLGQSNEVQPSLSAEELHEARQAAWEAALLAPQHGAHEGTLSTATLRAGINFREHGRPGEGLNIHPKYNFFDPWFHVMPDEGVTDTPEDARIIVGDVTLLMLVDGRWETVNFSGNLGGSYFNERFQRYGESPEITQLGDGEAAFSTPQRDHEAIIHGWRKGPRIPIPKDGSGKSKVDALIVFGNMHVEGLPEEQYIGAISADVYEKEDDAVQDGRAATSVGQPQMRYLTDRPQTFIYALVDANAPLPSVPDAFIYGGDDVLPNPEIEYTEGMTIELTPEQIQALLEEMEQRGLVSAESSAHSN